MGSPLSNGLGVCLSRGNAGEYQPIPEPNPNTKMLTVSNKYKTYMYINRYRLADRDGEHKDNASMLRSADVAVMLTTMMVVMMMMIALWVLIRWCPRWCLSLFFCIFCCCGDRRRWTVEHPCVSSYHRMCIVHMFLFSLVGVYVCMFMYAHPRFCVDTLCAR